MTTLKEFFDFNQGNLIDKWQHYFDIYEFWFKKYKNNPVVILEIGIFQGGSLNMWRNYFGSEAIIYGIDINPLCKQFESVNTKIFIGSQEDKSFLDYVKTQIPKIDILIDDGGHTMAQQIITFNSLYEHVKDDGIYLCEDLHTSYWKNYGGGFRKKDTFVEFSKTFIDKINAWHSKDSNLLVDDFTKSTYGLHFYDSILLIEKKKISIPQSKRIGKVIIPIKTFNTGATQEKKSFLERFLIRLKQKFISLI